MRAIKGSRRNALVHDEPIALPPRRPQSLPGSLWAITGYFNPQGYQSRKRNYQPFRERLRQQGVSLLVVELGMGRPFELQPQDAEILVQLPGGDKMWQRERLLNIALENLPTDCDKVVWIDTDILFERDDWALETARLLEDYPVVQPFSRFLMLERGESFADGLAARQDGDSKIMASAAWKIAHTGMEVLHESGGWGHSGFVWAARRNVFEGIGFFDTLINGRADIYMLRTFYGGSRYMPAGEFTRGLDAPARAWAETVYERVGGSVGWLDGRVFHLWHGSLTDRAYGQRIGFMHEHDFDPATDLRQTEHGAWEWASDKPGLHGWFNRYFQGLRED